jgi:osmoprotectant transport system substrate-binding protein
VVPVVRQEILDKHGEEFAQFVNSVTNRLSTATLRELNRRVELGGDDPIEVAREWLEKEGIDS